ncbi:hypothetical protein [Shinella sp. BYT-45]|uniref:hypothetical protein n=1 Tax=Shinella sp. BYT-45 TaxID=3377377 RepID=UPI003980122D
MYETGLYVGVVIWPLAGLWLLASLILALFRRRRKGALRQAGIAAIVFVLSFAGILYCNLNVYKDYGLSSPEGLAEARAARRAQEEAGTKIPEAVTQEAAARKEAETAAKARPTEEAGQCPVGTVVAVKADYEIRQAPGENAGRVVNEKATSILKTTHYHRIDPSTSVEILGCEENWTEIRITEPSWLASVRGWAPNEVLRDIERTADGARVYVENDVAWDGDTSRHKPEIVTMINKISREHAGCSSIDTGSLARSASRSKPGDPVFFVTCDPSGTPFNVWFRPGDVERTMTAARPIGQADAVQACEEEARRRATHPSTVDFSRFLDVAYSARPDGRVSLTSSFTARNGFNLEQTFAIRCLFDGNTMIEATVSEPQ